MLGTYIFQPVGHLYVGEIFRVVKWETSCFFFSEPKWGSRIFLESLYILCRFRDKTHFLHLNNYENLGTFNSLGRYHFLPVWGASVCGGQEYFFRSKRDQFSFHRSKGGDKNVFESLYILCRFRDKIHFLQLNSFVLLNLFHHPCSLEFLGLACSLR